LSDFRRESALPERRLIDAAPLRCEGVGRDARRGMRERQ